MNVPIEGNCNAASAGVLASIAQKRAGRQLNSDQIARVVADFVSGAIPDYQMAAWLATVACRGMNIDETIALTAAYMAGGRRIRFDGISGPVVDKHSTGGVGDKTSLVVVPIVAACGVAVAKMSGRGLMHAGGTIDKLEAIEGLRLNLTASQMVATLREVNMSVVAQSAELAPGDGATYGLRDVSGTVESIPLIAASIMSKKVAVGADGLVLDVKTGAGALIANPALAEELAQTMLHTARSFGLSCRVALTDMTQPLGRAVGNAMEVREALAALRGERIPGLSELCDAIARLMLQSADSGLSDAAARDRVAKAVTSGAAYEQFLRWAAAQGGNARQLERPELLPTTAYCETVHASQTGWVRGVDPVAIGTAAARVGAGRLRRESAIDHAAGVLLHRRIGDRVNAGEPLAEVHYNCGDISAAIALVRAAFSIDAWQPTTPPSVHAIFDGPKS